MWQSEICLCWVTTSICILLNTSLTLSKESALLHCGHCAWKFIEGVLLRGFWDCQLHYWPTSKKQFFFYDQEKSVGEKEKLQLAVLLFLRLSTKHQKGIISKNTAPLQQGQPLQQVKKYMKTGETAQNPNQQWVMLEDNIPQDFNSFQVHTWTFKFRQNSQWTGDLFLSFKLDQACHTFPK